MRYKLQPLVLLCFFFSSAICAQTTKIVSLLNSQFYKEQKMYKASDSERPILFKAYEIVNDSLRYSLRKTRQNKPLVSEISVALKDIITLDRDFNVIFRAKPGSVSGKIFLLKHGQQSELVSSYNDDMFFTALKMDQDDSKFKKKLLKAFSKSGYLITNKYWYY